MADFDSPPRPAWQTDELEDEWIEPTEDDEHNLDHDNTFSSLSQGTRSISMTTPIAGILNVISNTEDITDDIGDPTTTTTSQAGGTFLVRQDMPAVPLLPQTPGWNNKKGLVKDFFSPLPLERMFEPPSPPPQTQSSKPPNQPAVSSRLAQEYIPHLQESSTEVEEDEPVEEHVINTNLPKMKGLDNHQFTFNVPRHNSNDMTPPVNGVLPQAQSTPLPPAPSGQAPMTDPRLKLFQFQYDTFTRDHLSAIVDSIAVNTPSGGTRPTPTPSNKSSYISERDPGNTSHLRSTKRVRLSPRSDFGEGDGDGASIARPKIFGADYLGESRKMMEQIKSARDFSTISTVASGQARDDKSGDVLDRSVQQREQRVEARPTLLTVPPTHGNPSSTPSSNTSSTNSRLEKYSSLAYRKQAADLMAQIKSDMKGSKRIFSGDTDFTEKSTHHPRGGSEDKENEGLRERRGHHRASSSTSTAVTRASRHTQVSNGKGKMGASPRKLLRRPSAADEVDRELADGVADMSIEDHGVMVPTITTADATAQGTIRMPKSPNHPPTGLLAPITYPSNSIRVGANDDLNRFVSSSTATSGTTLTVGSTQSFVKHPGPGGNIRRIAPEEVQGMLGERVGRMVFDKVMMKWVKGVPSRMVEVEEERTELTRASTESEDPFRDIESLREDDTRGAGEHSIDETDDGMSRITETEREDAEADDEEERELTSFSFDGPSAGVVNVMTGVDTDDFTTDSEDEEERGLVTEVETEHEHDLGDGFDSDEEMPTATLPPVSAPAFTTPLPARTQTEMVTPMVRGMVKSTSNTPVSALKNGSGPRHHRTPANRLGHRRSVSFSDGKREGPIKGVGRNARDGPDFDKSIVLVPSARSKRIADMMEDLESPDDNSPTKTSTSSRRSSEEMQPLAVRKHNANTSNDVSRRVFSRSQTCRPSPGDNYVKANATFLTECSFAVSHDRLVQVITDVEPFEPYWEEIHTIDLSKKNVESVARLKEFLPKLDSLSLNTNQLSWLSGVPGTVRTLSVSSNLLTGITSYSHLLNLENLDISHNDIDTLRQLDCLRHLRELRADGNKISSIDGLQKLSGLVKLSLQGNSIRDVDLTKYRWSRLEMLNLSRNRLDNVDGLSSLPSLIALNVDHNSLGDLEPHGSMPKLRILRVSGNRLYRLNVKPFPNLRTLYADNNALSNLVKVNRLTKLENLSLRNQSGRGFSLSTREIRDVKRLYLSGNALNTDFIEEPCYNLVYLELAACRLTTLPPDLGTLVPNLRVLNLNYNFVEDARPLEGLTRLKKLTLIGSRLKGTKPLIRILQRMPDVEMLDFRMNPCTLGWYLPLLVRDVPGALQPSEGSGDKVDDGLLARGERGTDFAWRELDSKFRRDLPDESYLGRLAYRGLVMRACSRIRMLDGVDVSEKERVKAHHLLEGISGKRQSKKKKEDGIRRG